ncbi:SOS response-associated peptidase [Niveispirillum cyanobacteriorum]|nr:SOS response-associated peptidase family protein [Niveispirillum cyanobacteriorum]GGE85712.1 hypothetical protein GCM10011317_48620 [Niveispirillum cyanobacteriorum]
MEPRIDHSRLAGTLGDLIQQQIDLCMFCQVCDDSRLWAYDWLDRRAPPEMEIAEWSRRYRCPRCGTVGASDSRRVPRSNPNVQHLGWIGAKEGQVCNRYQASIQKLGLSEEIFGFEPWSETSLEIFPDRLAPVVRMEDGIPTWRAMRWGMPPFKDTAHPITNIRNLTSPWWQRWLSPPNRCLVPFERFAEYTADPGPKKDVWFRVTDDRPAAFAGIWTGWEGTRGPKSAPVTGHHDLFGFLTTEPNDLVGGVHPKAMPVILIGQQAMREWLTAPMTAVSDFARPVPDEEMEIIEGVV